MHELWITISNMHTIDALDVVLVAVLFYAIFALLRETRSFVALMGFITLMLGSMILFLIARAVNLQAMTLIFRQFWILIVLIFLIVFQLEFKKALTDIGQLRIFRSFFPSRERDVLGEIVLAVQLMAARNIGALMAIERHNPLRPYSTTGTLLDAQVTSELVRTVFTPYSPLHDGALLIKGERLMAAGCILPLSDTTDLDHDLGTRHRAALALAEQTDAIVIVVSEETGTISIAVDGKMVRGFDGESLRRRLAHDLELEEPMQPSEDAASGALGNAATHASAETVSPHDANPRLPNPNSTPSGREH